MTYKQIALVLGVAFLISACSDEKQEVDDNALLNTTSERSEMRHMPALNGAIPSVGLDDQGMLRKKLVCTDPVEIDLGDSPFNDRADQQFSLGEYSLDFSFIARAQKGALTNLDDTELTGRFFHDFNDLPHEGWMNAMFYPADVLPVYI